MPLAPLSRSFIRRLASFSGAWQSSGTFLRRNFWIWPLGLALILAVVGYATNAAIEAHIRERSKNILTIVLNAEVEAVKLWLHEMEGDAHALASAPDWQPQLLALVKLAENSQSLQADLLTSPDLKHLQGHLREPLEKADFGDFALIDPQGCILGSLWANRLGERLTGERKAFFDQVMARGASVSLPHLSQYPVKDRTGELRSLVPTMWAAAPVKDQAGKVVAAFGLRIRPGGKFSDILRIARPGESGETYAFNKNGRMISQSRFEPQLKEIGLLPNTPEAESVLQIEVRDPGVNLALGERASRPRAEQPLTRMAAMAVTGESNYDVQGYRDYRGVPVIGAWTWLPDYQFGIATEIDVEEALTPLQPLKWTFAGLLSLLVLCGLGVLTAVYMLDRQQKATKDALLAVKKLGQYTLEEKIGSGGMGSVYKARHAMLRRPTAIKLMDQTNPSDHASARFEQEAQLTARLTHPNTITIYDYGRTEDGTFFYVMEYLEGIDLQTLVAHFGVQPEGRAIYILRQVCESLAEAHSISLIHRDIKPANILLTRKAALADFVKVLDFGLAKTTKDANLHLTAANMIVGTPQYLAPEGFTSPNLLDARGDIYAVGAVGYFLMTGCTVFEGNSLVDICQQQMLAIPIAPSERSGRKLAVDFEQVLLRCLAKRPEDRPRDMSELIHLLDCCEDAEKWKRADAERWWQEHMLKPIPQERPPKFGSTADTVAATQIPSAMKPLQVGRESPPTRPDPA